MLSKTLEHGNSVGDKLQLMNKLYNELRCFITAVLSIIALLNQNKLDPRRVKGTIFVKYGHKKYDSCTALYMTFAPMRTVRMK